MNLIYCPNCRKMVSPDYGIGYDQRIVKLGRMQIKTVRQVHCSSCFCFIQEETTYRESKGETNITFGELL